MAKYLYNDIELPQLPEWDKTAYPYVYIIQAGVYDDGTPHYRVWCCTVTIGYGFNSSKPTKYAYTADGTGMMCATYDAEAQDNSAWGSASGAFSCNASSTLSSNNVVWSNYDILNNDGSVYLATSYPIDAETGKEIHDYEIVEFTLTARDIYKVINGKPTKLTLYKKLGGKLIPLDEHTKEVKT